MIGVLCIPKSQSSWVMSKIKDAGLNLGEIRPYKPSASYPKDKYPAGWLEHKILQEWGRRRSLGTERRILNRIMEPQDAYPNPNQADFGNTEAVKIFPWFYQYFKERGLITYWIRVIRPVSGLKKHYAIPVAEAANEWLRDLPCHGEINTDNLEFWDPAYLKIYVGGQT